jgi:hypothetical protein
MLNLLDDWQILLKIVSITNAAKLEDWAKSVAFELRSTLEETVLALEQNKGVLNDIFQNKIGTFFIFSNRWVAIRLEQQQQRQINKITMLYYSLLHHGRLIIHFAQQKRNVVVEQWFILKQVAVCLNTFWLFM